MKTLDVVCPVYNEEAVISRFYAELKQVLSEIGSTYAWSVLFIVDRSEDRTLDLLKEIAASDRRVKVLSMSARFGHQMSLVAGLDHSDADIVIMMDSDLQHPPQVIPTLLAAFESGNDIVYTVRRHAPDTGWLKRTSSRMFYRVINSISDVQINENAADFRLISNRVARVFRQHIRERNQFLRGLMSWVGFNSAPVTFDAGHRPAGKSKYSVGRMIRFGADGVVSFSNRPLQAAILVGVGFSVVGFLIAFVVAARYLASNSSPSGWAAVAILLLIFSGIQLVFMGIIGEYIGAIFNEVKGRPHYIVDQRINFDARD